MLKLKLSDFDYTLPKKLIAQFPCEKRDESRLLVLNRNTGQIEHRLFKDIVEYFNEGDALVLNDTKVVPARLIGRKETGGKVDVLILRVSERLKVKSEKDNEYEALVKPLRGLKVGGSINFKDGELKADITRIDKGRLFLRFCCNGNFHSLLTKFGKVPLPPYIKRESVEMDRKRYQTVYAKKEGAIAAPTAGLHFTKSLLKKIEDKGIDIEYVTLQIGYGTFKPVKCEDISSHKMEEEHFEISEDTKDRLDRVKKEGGRVFAVGTTTCRVLETIVSKVFEAKLRTHTTDLFIYPPYKFKLVDCLLTNFHLPKTTLLMLASAFCGRELLFKSYREAIEKRYRFYSYGDAMLIL